ALNLSLLVGMLLGLSHLVRLGQVAGNSPQAVLGLLALGISLSSWAWRRDWTPVTYPAWIPVAVGLGSLTVVLFVWRALVQGQRDDQTALLGAVARGTEGRIQEAMVGVNLALWHAAWYSSPGAVGTKDWQAQADEVLRENPSLHALGWIGRDGSAV